MKRSKTLSIILVILIFAIGFIGDRYLPLPKNQKIEIKNPVIKSFAANLKKRLFDNLPYNHAALASGILLGDDSQLSKSVKKKFTDTGTSHIMAASGSNVSMVIAAVLLVLGWLNISSRFGAIIILFVLGFYAAISGMDPPIIRASLFGLTMLVSKVSHKYLNQRNVLLLVALAMLIQNPSLLFHSLSFQLSFAATIGIVYGCKYFETIFESKIKNRRLLAFFEIVSLPLMAYIFTMPILLYYFGKVSLISIPLNIVIAPLIPLIMLLSFTTIIIPVMTSSALYVLLEIMLKLVDFSSKHNFAQIRVSISISILVVCYAILVFLIKSSLWPNYRKNLFVA